MEGAVTSSDSAEVSSTFSSTVSASSSTTTTTHNVPNNVLWKNSGGVSELLPGQQNPPCREGGSPLDVVNLRNDIRPEPSSSSTMRQMSVESSSSSDSSSGYNNINFNGASVSGYTNGQHQQSTSAASSVLSIASGVSGCSGGGGGSPSKCLLASPGGPKFKLMTEGDVHLCKLNHSRTVISKILSSKFLRRWEHHHLFLSSREMSSKSPTGFMESPVPYTVMEEIYPLARWDPSQKFCLRIVIPDGSILLQASNSYIRDQWLHSLLWKRNILKFHKILTATRRPEVLTRELRGLVELALTTPLQDESVYQAPIDIISEFLSISKEWLPKEANEEILTIITPLLERVTPSPEICNFFCKHCKECPRSYLVLEMFTPVVQRILKHNLDFGKYPKTRVFIQEYVQTLSHQNDGLHVVKNFVSSMHGESSTCPHPRVLPNLIATCLAAIYSLFEERRSLNAADRNNIERINDDWESRHDVFVQVFNTASQFEDWRPSLAQLLQPLPFPDDALAYERFTNKFKSVVTNIVNDTRCDVHLMVLGIRDEKEGWFHLYCPGNVACDDEGDLWSLILKNLINCCCRRKKFLQQLNKCLGPCMLRALRDDETCQQVLCAMLELDVIENKDMQLQVISTLQSTPTGKHHYAVLCQWQKHLEELQQKGGPRKLTLPSRSTDSDLAKLLSCGSFGNLECLSLAFTQVTSACAEQLIKLPSLRYLNLWSTQFGDTGLQLISEHLHRLQVLNLCETPVTDKGLVSLSSLKNLQKLNLNSTHLSAQTFENLKKSLPALQECDIRYTDAW